MPNEIPVSGSIEHSHDSRDRRAAGLAACQHGVIAWWQLQELGFSQHMIRYRLETGRLYRVQPGVYALPPKVLAPGRLMAAALTCGPEAVLSHRAAAAVWDLGPWPTGRIDVTVPSSRKPRAGVLLHKVKQLERTTRDNFPVTPVARTLVDLAAVLHPRRLEDAFERAERLRIFDLSEVRTTARGRRGAKKIHAILADAAEPEPTRSKLERRLRELCREHKLPLPSQNVHLHGFEVDALWKQQRVVVETDGWEFHRTRRAFERDREKGAALERAGYRVLRFTWRQITREPHLVADTIRQALDESRWRLENRQDLT